MVARENVFSLNYYLRFSCSIIMCMQIHSHSVTTSKLHLPITPYPIRHLLPTHDAITLYQQSASLLCIYAEKVLLIMAILRSHRRTQTET